MKELKENIQMEIHLLQKKREYRRKEYHMVTHFTRCCGYGADLHNRSWLIEAEKKTAEWDGGISEE